MLSNANLILPNLRAVSALHVYLYLCLHPNARACRHPLHFRYYSEEEVVEEEEAVRHVVKAIARPSDFKMPERPQIVDASSKSDRKRRKRHHPPHPKFQLPSPRVARGQ